MEEEIIVIESEEEQEIIIIENDIEYISPTTQEKIITPTKEVQNVLPDDGIFALSKVTVEAVTNEIDSNIQPNNIKLGVNILGVDGILEPDKPDQTKTIKPTEETQTIKADIGYELAEVTVEPIPSEYTKVEGTIDITSNGTYNVKNYESANVNIGGLVIDDYRYFFYGGYRFDKFNEYLPLLKNGTGANNMFAETRNYSGVLDLSQLDCSKVTSADYMFQYLSSTSKNVSLILPEMPLLKSASNMFQGYGGDVLDISNLVFGQSISSSYMFWNAKFTKLIINKPYVMSINSNALTGTTIAKGTGYVYVPDNLKEQYQNYTNWSTYASQIKGMSEL